MIAKPSRIIPGWLPREEPQEPSMLISTALAGDLIGFLHGNASPEARRLSQELHKGLEKSTMDALKGMRPASSEEAARLRSDYRNALCAAGLWEALVKGDPITQRENPAECSEEAA